MKKFLIKVQNPWRKFWFEAWNFKLRGSLDGI